MDRDNEMEPVEDNELETDQQENFIIGVQYAKIYQDILDTLSGFN